MSHKYPTYAGQCRGDKNKNKSEDAQTFYCCPEGYGLSCGGPGEHSVRVGKYLHSTDEKPQCQRIIYNKHKNKPSLDPHDMTDIRQCFGNPNSSDLVIGSDCPCGMT